MHINFEMYTSGQVHYQCQEVSNLPHLHTHAEIIFVEEGSVECTIDDKCRVITQNEAALIFPNCIHRHVSLGYTRFIIGQYDIPSLGGYAHIFLKKTCVDPFLSEVDVHPDAAHCLRVMTHSNMSEIDDCLAYAYTNVILGRFLQRVKLAPLSQRASEHDHLRNVLAYILEHIKEPLTLDHLSKQLYINKYYISKLFSSKIGCNFRTYLNAIRLELARDMLKDPNQMISMIPYECGFESGRTFYRVFKKQLNMTPRMYQDTIGEQAHRNGGNAV